MCANGSIDRTKMAKVRELLTFAQATVSGL